MRRLVLGGMILILMFGSSFAKIHGWKGAVHLSAVPFIATTGIYSDVWTLHDYERNGTKAAAITNLSLLGVQTCLGATILFTSDDLPPAVRVIHHIVGAGVVASALWLSVANTRDPGITNLTRNTSYAYTILAAAPLILFTF
jgi:hypothetical protein